MAQLSILHINELHSRDKVRSMPWGQMLDELTRLKKTLAAAQEEIAFLTAERDELVEAVRSWAQDPEAPAGDNASRSRN